MKRFTILSLAFLVLLCISAVLQADDPIRVLQIAGDDVSAHNWQEISASTRKALEEDERFQVTLCEDPAILESSALSETYDVIVFLTFVRKLPPLTDAAKENLLEFVSTGGGFYSQHLASASYKDWPEFKELCGRCWVMGTSGHTDRSEFTVNIADIEHPITAGLEDFVILDELYSKLQGDLEITALVTAESLFTNKTEPLVFVRPYGKGRCIHNAMGHDAISLENPGMAELVRRGVEWAATGDVAE